MEKLKMSTPNLADENFQKLAALFPNAVTEAITGYDENGKAIIERAIDADVLRQEISATVLEGTQERYQFTWPDKKKSVVLSNQPITKTLRLVREKSVGHDGTTGSIDTENIYIEGDNLDALKLLQETYLGKVKMIYIDPPYNTGNDFIYDDDFSRDEDEYLDDSGQFDEDGGRLVQNLESNGRFHTDWLNMIYPRLRIAKDLLSDDGVIFISIDDNEVGNLKKICDEIFGAGNFEADIIIISNPGGRDYKKIAVTNEHLLVYSRNVKFSEILEINKETDFHFFDYEGGFELRELRNRNPKFHKGNRPNLFFPFYVNPDNVSEEGFCPVSTTPDESFHIEVFPFNSQGKESCWRWGREKANKSIIKSNTEASQIIAKQKSSGGWNIYEKNRRTTTKVKSVWDETEMRTEDGTRLLRFLMGESYFEHPKPIAVIKRCLEMTTIENDIILDFFSGSATTAHAVMKLNAEDGGHRKFILVQLPEVTPEKSEARKAGYKTICEIGEERIRRAGKKILAEDEKWNDVPLNRLDGSKVGDYTPAKVVDIIFPKDGSDPIELIDERKFPDVGFRVFKVDSSNMEDVYYNPKDFKQGQMSLLADNIKPDRTPEDLLFQVMLDLGILLSSKIEETIIDGKKVFSVANGYLIACFDRDVTEETVKAIAKQQPFYAVFRDAGMASDSVMTNFEQIFETYSPKTQRKVL